MNAESCYTSNKPNQIMTKTATIKVDDANLAYRVHGEGPAIVLINGIAATGTHWGDVGCKVTGTVSQ